MQLNMTSYLDRSVILFFLFSPCNVSLKNSFKLFHQVARTNFRLIIFTVDDVVPYWNDLSDDDVKVVNFKR